MDRIGTIPKNLYLTDRGISASGKGRRYRRTLEFFEGGKFVFLGEGWPKNETIDRSFRSSEPFRCFVVWNVHRGFRFVRGRISLVHLLIYFAQQFRRERVNGRTTRMILSDLRSPNSFANCSRACLNGRCARIGSTLDAYSISSRRSFDIIRMERALPLLSCYNYWKLFQSVRNILLKL